ncbi:hypothetical protein E2C01_050949 [Portunus trituberculatus]|uniref:Uncharacterized protein n=1 Tax=Portunus trituberculatus TaxID=210409 RepID=A0A5B7GAB2_PORTR|nr:hypothetical protein [Portunus trituberculatus]
MGGCQRGNALVKAPGGGCAPCHSVSSRRVGQTACSLFLCRHPKLVDIADRSIQLQWWQQRVQRTGPAGKERPVKRGHGEDAGGAQHAETLSALTGGSARRSQRHAVAVARRGTSGACALPSPPRATDTPRASLRPELPPHELVEENVDRLEKWFLEHFGRTVGAWRVVSPCGPTSSTSAGGAFITFAGYFLGWKRYQPSRDLINSITDFKMPTQPTLTDVRSWFSLVNQVAPFLAVTPVMEPFRELLKKPAMTAATVAAAEDEIGHVVRPT